MMPDRLLRETPRAVGSLRFDGVSKHFRSPVGHDHPISALDDVSFTIEPNSSVGLIGPNGAGKSTALKLAAGVSVPSSGRIHRGGHALAVIELGAGLHPDLTGRENIDLLTTLSAPRGSRSASRFDRIVEFSELGHVLDTPARQYSSGMIARLAFSVAAHCDPDLLLIDEVLSVGDLSFQQKCRDHIFDLRSRGTTVVIVSHDLGLVAEVCDRSLLLVGGRVELDGDSDAVIAHYLGQPARDRGGDEMDAVLRSATVESGDPLMLKLEIPPTVESTVLRFEYAVSAHASLQAALGLWMVFGSAQLADPPLGTIELSLETRGLPPGRYELHLSLETSDRDILRSSVLSFTLVGPPGPTAIRLSSSFVLDGVALETQS